MEKKNQQSSGKKNAAKTKWADSVAIAENPNQNGIELRFNAEPSHVLQSKLRASGFRPSKSQNMWYGDNTETNLAFASEIESILPTSPDGPDLILSPSFEAVKTNIEQRDFSFILITLKDGEIKSYIVFEPSKPKAEVMATQFARQEFGENFIALAVKPRTQMREARVLFDEGKIIFPNGQKIPTRKESAIKGSLPVTESLETEADKQRETERMALDKFYKWVTLQEDETIRPSKISRELFEKWFKDNYPKLTVKNVESIWQSHQRILKSLTRFEKRSSGKGLMQPYSSIYNKLMKVIPNLVQHIQEGKYHGKSQKDPNSGLMSLNYDYVATDKDGTYIIALSHNYEQNGDLVPDPDMQIRIHPDQEVAEALTFQDYRSYQEVYSTKDGKKYVNTGLKKDLNKFLNRWLTNIIHQGHKIDLSKEKSELEEHEAVDSDNSFNKAYQQLLQLIPGLLNYNFKGRLEGEFKANDDGTLRKILYTISQRQDGKSYEVWLNEFIGDRDELQSDIVVEPDNQKAYVTAEWLSFYYAGKYDREESEEEIDERDGDIGEEMTRGLTEWLEDILSLGYKIDLSEGISSVHSDFKRLHTPQEEKEIKELFVRAGYPKLFSAQEAIDQQYPVIDVAFRYDTPTEYFTEAIEEPNLKEISKLKKELRALKGKSSNERREKLKADIEKLTTQVNKAEQLINDEADIFHDDLFQLILDKAKEKGHHPEGEDQISQFREYVMNNILDNRAIENYHRQPVNELMEELIDEYFSQEKKSSGIDRPTAATDKTKVTDLKSGDTFVPNVLVPVETQEPFYSHLFRMYDMKEILKNDFSHLLKLNDNNLSKASPIALFELIQLAHPNEYGIDVSRQELIKEFEKRGKSIFQGIGFPTDENYPYVNLHLGYESIEPLNEMLFDNNKEGDEWWSIAEHARPIADVKKAIKFIEQMIAKEKNEMQTYVNPKTGKPKLDSKHLVRDIELTIESLENSKEVLQHYLDNPSEKLTNQTEEKSDDVLANEHGVYTSKTAGENYEQIKIPIQKTAQYKAEIKIATTSQGDFRMGVSSSKLFGDYTGGGYEPSAEGRAFTTRKEALQAGLVEIIERLNGLIKSKDTILNNEDKKVKQLTSALSAVKDFANENDIDLLNVDNKSLGKVFVKEIYLTTEAVSRIADFSKAFVTTTWEQADSFVKGKIGRYSDVYYKVIWEDGETLKGYIDIEPSDFFKHKHSVLSEHLQVYFRNISNADPRKDGIVKKEDVEEAKAMLSKYSFSDSDSANQVISSANERPSIIKGLEAAYWIKEDKKYPVDKIIVKEMEFNQARLREAIRTKLEKLPIATLNEIVKELALKFKERRPLSAYEKSLVTIGKTGDKRKATLIASYVDDMILDTDLKDKLKSPVMTFLVELLFSGEQKLVDLPQDIEKQTVPKPKKQSQFDLNKEIEAFIDKKDKGGSYFNEEEKNYIRQYTGSGGLLKEGATGRGALYEYYTPELVVKKMWEMAYHFGYDGGAILEPSVGTGNFLKYAPKGAIIFGFETNHYSARIAQILYPNAHIHEKAFESLFFAGNVHLKNEFNHPLCSLVIGNPPYGEFTGKYAGMGEKQYTGATEYDQYFILRGLDLLNEGGLLVFLIPSSFVTNQSKFNKVKEKIAAKADLLDLYRLPARVFETTDIGTDILVLKKHTEKKQESKSTAGIDKENLPLIKAKFNGKCSITGLPIKTGDEIFYNPDTKQTIRAIKIKNVENISPLLNPSSWLFKIVEQLFWNYMEKHGRNNELNEKYFSEDAIYDKAGAIQGGIELIFEIMREENVDFCWLHKIDITDAFSD